MSPVRSRLATASARVLGGLGLVPLAACLGDWPFHATGIARSVSFALLTASAIAAALTSLPALVLARRRPWAAVALAALHPAVWVAVMSRL